MLNEVVVTTPTIGSNVEEFQYKNFHFLMWDIGGQESLRPSWSTYYVNTKVRLRTRARTHAMGRRPHRCTGRPLPGGVCVGGPRQVVIMVVDSTDAQRLHLSKRELQTMMAQSCRSGRVRVGAQHSPHRCACARARSLAAPIRST